MCRAVAMNGITAYSVRDLIALIKPATIVWAYGQPEDLEVALDQCLCPVDVVATLALAGLQAEPTPDLVYEVTGPLGAEGVKQLVVICTELRNRVIQLEIELAASLRREGRLV